jgi:Tol biopolymer transport system component
MTDGTTSDHLPEITADGRYMVFISTRTGTYQLWRMDIDGGNLKQLTDGRNGIGMSCITSDGRWVVYSPFGGVDGGIWKVSIDGGNPIKLIEKSTAGYPQVSLDGKLLACHFDGDATKIIVTTFDNGSPVKTVNLPETSFSPFRWSHDGRALIYIDTRQGVSNLWSQPLDGSAPRQITDFKSDVIYQFASSRDGHQLALARGNGTSDAVLISDSK